MRQAMRVSLLLAFVGNLAWALSAKANFNGNLTVEIDGFKNKQGQVCASIFAKSQGFPNNRDRVLQRQCTKITDIPVKLNFENLPAGSYAVAAMHDSNEDLKLNRNSLGMPTEGFGFSKNPEVNSSAPKFSDAAIVLAGPNTSIQIHLKYF
ncbi:hypothetical protein BV372_30120 [Nostoc sp. T09]|uniref:DUF2141 domain-containing protein n=1 Tax=Nostoc sp. T09 TaxID=1932621 RepID=UPI000A3B82F0|nr:DUF2141 domain-containing protein [Nostoc sp. T09]OUL23187.1 hypothetical protein BV372_30120 [Nostoc sp. T09]